MRGQDEQQLGVFSYISPEQRIPHDHPLRQLRVMADEALRELKLRFNRLYAKTGRPSIAPEKLLRALLLQVLYSVRSERMLMEQLDYSLMLRWFVGLNMDDPIWDVTVFTKNRQRLLAGDIADVFFAAVLKQARQRNLLPDEHFTVDGTLLEAWAGQKSFRRVDNDQQPPATGTGEGSNPTVNFHREKRSNQTHCSTTDPDAMLSRKSRGSRAVLAYRGHLLTENRNGLVISTLTTRAYGSAERHAALLMAEGLPGTHRVTQNDTNRRSGVDERTTRHAGYQISQKKRKRIEEVFGWMKSIGLLRKLRHRGLERVGWMFTFAAAAYNLVRIRNLIRSAPMVQRA
jgi:transposase